MTNRDNNKHYMLYTIEEAISSLSEETGVELLSDAFLDKAIAHFDKTYKSEKVSVWRHLGGVHTDKDGIPYEPYEKNYRARCR